MKLLSLFLFVLKFVNIYSEFHKISKQKINLIHKLMGYYLIENTNLYIASENSYEIKFYVENFINLENITTLNIHTKSSKFLHNEDTADLFIIVPNSTASLEEIIAWPNILSLLKTKLLILILSKEIFYYNVVFLFVNSNIIFIIEGNDNLLKCNVLDEKFEEFNSMEEFILIDSYNVPERYWPNIKINYENERYFEAYFPLLIYLENKTSGLLGYFVKIFENYYKTRLERIVGKSKIQNRRMEDLEIYPDVADLLDGYPLKMGKVCFMFPVLDEISEEDFLKKPFHLSIWVLIFICLLCFGVSLKILIKEEYFNCFFEILTISLGSTYKGINNKYLNILFFLYGFIIWNLYSAKLSSYLTTPNLGKTLETVEEVRKSNLSLWGNYYKNIENLTDYLKQNFPKISKYQEIFKGQFDPHIKHKEFYKHLYDFDLNHGYLVNDVIWNFIGNSQKLLQRKLFSYSKICPKNGFIYPFFHHDKLYILSNVFSSFTLKVLESGLDYIWELYSYLDIKFKYKREEVQHSWTVLGFKYFEVTWWILFVGIFSSILVFIFEIWYSKKVFVF